MSLRCNKAFQQQVVFSRGIVKDGTSVGGVDPYRIGSILVGLTHTGWEVYR